MFLIFGIVCLILALIGGVIAIENEHANNGWEPFGAALFIAGLIGFIAFFVLQAVADDNQSERNAKRLDELNLRSTKDCAPYAVVHRHENDSYIVYACANDNKIKVLKK